MVAVQGSTCFLERRVSGDEALQGVRGRLWKIPGALPRVVLWNRERRRKIAAVVVVDAVVVVVDAVVVVVADVVVAALSSSGPGILSEPCKYKKRM